MISVTLFNIFIIALAVLIHSEALYFLSQYIRDLKIPNRLKVLVAVFGSLLAHIIEIGLFAIALLLSLRFGYGELQGNYFGSFLDLLYLSFASYTSLGLGDIAPIGHIRFLVGIEALVGLALITWSASFIYIEMQKFWDKK
jgi:hypothetical protein